MAEPPGERVERYRRARRDPAFAVLEGIHVLKHALRFGAEVLEGATPDPGRLARLVERLAPDLIDRLAVVQPVSPAEFAALAPTPPATGVLAIARRPRVELAEILAAPGPAPIVLLQEPSRLANIGAAVRVAAAAGAAGVVAVGRHDPWHPAALRGAAGLHWAVPVARAGALPESSRPLVAIDVEGDPLLPGSVPARALLAFGSERRGLSVDLRARAERRLTIPMRTGVSSLNLATAVAVALYTWRLEA